jgi:hypothetical protein
MTCTKLEIKSQSAKDRVSSMMLVWQLSVEDHCTWQVVLGDQTLDDILMDSIAPYLDASLRANASERRNVLAGAKTKVESQAN